MNSLEMNNIEEIKTLNPYQQEAVLDESLACLVNANVGSGKTTVLIEKVRHLHEKKQVSYEKMAVLTFTNKAADEIAERLSRKEAELTEEELWGFGTFHSVALRILRRFLPGKEEHRENTKMICFRSFRFLRRQKDSRIKCPLQIFWKKERRWQKSRKRCWILSGSLSMRYRTVTKNS